MSATKKISPLAALIAAVLLAIFGKQISGTTAQTLGLILAGLFGATSVAVHKPTVKKVVHKVVTKPVKKVLHVPPKPKNPITMYDSIEVSTLPHGAAAVAGYTSGFWPTFEAMVKAFPKAFHLSIAINKDHDADCLDIEKGDATPAEAPAWVSRQHARGIKRPVVYASLSQMGVVLAALRRAGIPRIAVRVWSAHYTYHPHICGPHCGLETIADGTQYTDKALGRNLDASLLDSGFFGG